jgi:hypothetical protein
MSRRISVLVVMVLLASVAALPGASVTAQDTVTPLRVEVAVTGTLTAASPTVVYSFDAVESLRMAVVFDVLSGDMQPSLVVLAQDQTTTLASATGPYVNGLIVQFPATGTYYLGITADSGTSATYRLIINASPVLPINPFVAQTFMVSGKSTVCTENTPVGWFSPNEDLNVCFSVAQIENPLKLKAEWWSPSGNVVVEENLTLDSSMSGTLYLTGIVNSGQPWEQGWWQVHFLIDGELAHIQWVPVTG